MRKNIKCSLVSSIYEENYVICGDNCLYREYGVTDEDIVGVLTGFYRDNCLCLFCWDRWQERLWSCLIRCLEW